MVKLKLNGYIQMNVVRAMEDKILLFNGSHSMILINDVQVTEEEETYGRKGNKTRQVQYLQCKVYGYNPSGKFLGVHDEETARRYLEYDLFNLRKNYLDLKEQWQVMGKLEKELNMLEEQ